MYWCQGAYKEVTGNDVIQIPAYSFIFATAQEQACMPRFVSGNFDLSVSMFFSGVVLSNGPQVDPGYRGALFCMLYNTTDQPVPINRGAKFATLQFFTTTHVTSGYSGAYQRKSTFRDFVSSRMAISQGGQILERVNKVHSSNSLFKNIVITWLAVTSAIAIGAGTWAFYAADKAISASEKAASATEKVTPAVDSLEKQKEGMDARLRKMEEMVQKIKVARR